MRARWIFGAFAASVAAVAGASCSNAAPFRALPNEEGTGGSDCEGDDCSFVPEDACAESAPGCPCDVEGDHLVCSHVVSQVGDQPVCGMGYAVCSDGVWDECIINNTVTIAPTPVPHPPGTYWPDSLGKPVKCAANPCDPRCWDFPDTPEGLGSPDGGIAATDGGLTLLGGDAGVAAPACTGGPTAKCSHSICGAGAALTPGCDNAPAPAAPLGCVAKICAAYPACCSGQWDGSCAAAVPALCNVTCGNLSGTCAVCYKDATDHDGDGYSFSTGDCADCDPAINPGAFDFAGNGIDEDCTGVADDEPTTCGAGLAMASNQPADYAKAMDLCRFTTASATGAAKTWGVIAPQLVQADKAQAPHALSYGILGKFGTNNAPQKGPNMAVFSSGTARGTADPGWVNPNGQYGSFNQGKTSAYPTGLPKSKTGCPQPSGKANDSSGLAMSIRVPTNAKSFSYRFNFFSPEYPEYVCTAYNDSFVALLKSGYLPANPASNSGNISFDSQNNPVSVNVGFFTITSGPKLTGTAMDGTCGGQICGGATDWLETTAPVVPGETIDLQLAVWDAGDHLWDSTVLVDAFTWSVTPATFVTQVPVAPAPITYKDGYFTRDYDASQLCPVGTKPVWGLWSWAAATPADSCIRFSVQTASTAAGLSSAPVDALQFSSPPGPAAVVGTQAVARTGSPNTTAGSAVVDATLFGKGRIRNQPFLRVTSHLTPSNDKLSAPTLSAWDLQVSCAPAE